MDNFPHSENRLKAYNNIFKKLGFKYAVAEADSGNIGGNKSEEFHVLSKIGEVGINKTKSIEKDVLLHCNTCNYVSNVEKAVGKSVAEFKVTLGDLQYLSDVKTEVVRVFVDMDKKEPKQFHAAVVLQKDRVVNLVKVQRFFGADDVKLLSGQEAEDAVKTE